MNPAAFALLLTSGFGLFTWSIARKWRLLVAGAPRPETKPDIRRQLSRLVIDGLLQSRMRKYKAAGIAHTFVFFGFVVLLLRTLTLWGRGFDPGFDLPALGPRGALSGGLGAAYNELKDIATALVLAAVSYFVILRTFVRPRRLTLSIEGLVILGLIGTMMIADTLYDGASLVLARTWDQHCSVAVAGDCAEMRPLVSGVGWHSATLGWRLFPDPLGSMSATLLRGLSTHSLTMLGLTGYWVHSTLVLVFLNLLPYSKHFHIITALPNVFFAPTQPAGKLNKLASSAEQLLEKADAQQTAPPNGEPPLGLAKVADLHWKYRLDLLTCTECGRCTDHCPAHAAGKPLSPKQLTLDLRRQLRESNDFGSRAAASTAGEAVETAETDGLVPNIIAPETLWACTTCRACEEQCPVGISYVDKIVDFRRDLVLMRGEVPNELQRAFDGMEHAGNPWGLPRSDRVAWAQGLSVRQLAEVERTDVLFWVGCAASYDERAKKVARSFVRLLQSAEIDFAVLGEEETCTGDAARRAGNEYLFLQLASHNVEVLNQYYDAKKFRRIVTACPHCLTTLKHEYPDFGGRWPILHHQQLLLELVKQGRLQPNRALEQTAVLHDPCTLARYADDIISPRDLLRKVGHLSLREAERHGRHTRCCGAGGARFWMDDAPDTRMNVVRSEELRRTGADTIVTACPFCTTMIEDGTAASKGAERTRVADIAELLAEACDVSG